MVKVNTELKSKRMLTEAETAELFGISQATLRCWRNQGRGPRYYKLHPGRRGHVRYRVEDVDAYLCGQPVETVDSLKLQQQEG